MEDLGMVSSSVVILVRTPFGNSEGRLLCLRVGLLEGRTDGLFEGIKIAEALREGTLLTVIVGAAVGDTLGIALGRALGDDVGTELGVIVGAAVGDTLGIALGRALGDDVGTELGVIVGATVAGICVGFAD